VNPFFLSAGDIFSDLEIEIRTDAEADEFWSYIGNKGNQRWTWYAIERKSGIILAWHNGKRTDESCACLVDKLSVFPIKYYYTDDWSSYSKYIPSHKHIIGKDNTWKIGNDSPPPPINLIRFADFFIIALAQIRLYCVYISP